MPRRGCSAVRGRPTARRVVGAPCACARIATETKWRKWLARQPSRPSRRPAPADRGGDVRSRPSAAPASRAVVAGIAPPASRNIGCPQPRRRRAPTERTVRD
ncbi:hypothetical protein FE374_04255 [Georgenia yuyongxinii]|uniref:Uncharacterized protein n=1 Tax=Georgenia yuyongxinii TaxID=2589797 RepID=A0A5B8C4B7_9MICO|nr:hypothetical protein FE374_04255 [Georgenia yuyongxinii]